MSRIVSSAALLLVDDEAYIRELGQIVLEQAGYQVATADGGPAALQHFARPGARFDLVILDLTMPELTGWEVLRSLIAHDPDVRVLLSSAYSSSPPDDALPAQVRGFLPKPYRPHDLVAQVRAVLK